MPLVLPRAAAFAASSLVHVGMVALVGGHLTESPANRVNGAPVDIAIDVALVTATAAVPVVETAPAKVSSPPGLGATHRHPYHVPPEHDARPHDPSAPHLFAHPAPSPAPAAAVVEAPTGEPVRFVLPKGGPFVSHGTFATSGAGAEGDVPSSGEETVGEAEVATPARLITGGTASYTVEAREAGIEADVPVQIVIDGFGRVVEARAEKVTGYGLDGAAVRSVRTYRFSPALKDGHPVRVRMRWTVEFRLR